MMDVLDIKEAAALLRVSTKTVHRYASKGILPHVRMGSVVRFRLETLQAWMQEQEQQSLQSSRHPVPSESRP